MSGKIELTILESKKKVSPSATNIFRSGKRNLLHEKLYQQSDFLKSKKMTALWTRGF